MSKDASRSAWSWCCWNHRCRKSALYNFDPDPTDNEQQALSNNSVSDFLILEYNSEIGGRLRHAPFGKDGDGNPYTVELGANWVCLARESAIRECA